MRERLHISRDIQRCLLQIVDPLGEDTFQGWGGQPELLELYREKRQTLIDVVMSS